MINHEHKFLFIHIPRTSGSSIESQFIFDKNTKHWILNDWKKYLEPEIFDSYFKFSFVRNPWDFIISKYMSPAFSCVGKKSGQSLRYFLKHYKTPKNEHGEFFHDYFKPEQMDFIGRFENRENDLNYISKKIGLNIDKRIHIRKIQMQDKNKKHYTYYYDEETKQIVAARYAQDIEYFGYKFGE